MLDEIKKLERKAYLKFLAGIILGIIPIIIFRNIKGTIAVLFIIAGLLLIIISLLGCSAT